MQTADGVRCVVPGSDVLGETPLWCAQTQSLLWLDIEEANSWSDNTALNAQVIQGAIDYLNTQNIRAGIYSVPYMWKRIAGAGFSPAESLNSANSPVPTWFPIGINTQVGATNACLTRASFIPGSPVWIIQYVADSTAVDQNIACYAPARRIAQ